jgi:predicted dehydrogenase
MKTKPTPTALPRRRFLQTSALAAAGPLILPHLSLFGANAPSNKLNIALIGVWGRALAHYPAIEMENVVALCDVNEGHLANAAKKFTGAKTYVDWRKCLDQKDINAVVICTPDHHHAFIANWALNRGHHVYCEKPLAISVEEARIVRANYLKNRHKVATQVGTQRHESENFNRVAELVRDGAVGELQQVSAWGNRQLRRDGYLPPDGNPPPDLHWDLWLGPSPYHHYNPGYFSGGPGMNCLQWNMFWDFGTGQVGDMGAHTMDLAWKPIDATLPISVEASGEPFNAEVTPVRLEFHLENPATDWRPPIRVSWYQGGVMPATPAPWVDLNKIGHGALFEGSHGALVAEFNARLLIPQGHKADLTYYRPRSKHTLLPAMGNFQQQWINACKTDLKTSCDFEYNGNLTESMMLGLVAYRAGKKLTYDPAAGRITNAPEANQFLRREYRDGWTLDG